MDSYDDRGVGGGGERVADPDPRTVPGPRTGPGPRSGPEPREGSAGPGGTDRPEALRAGMAGLSFPYQIAAAVALSVIGVIGCVQLAMVFLHVAPSNTLTKQHGEAVDEWVYPEFEQNWKLFAPNPLQQNVAVQARAEIAGPDGRRTTSWTNLSGQDGQAIRGNLLPSHVQQNELRRAWDFYVGSHDAQNRANGLRGTLSEQYIRRIVMLRLGEHDHGDSILRIQVRSEVRAVAAPAWSDEKISTAPSYRVLPWWTVTGADLPEGTADSEKADQ
ncbi:DUF5819 family protein [Streptomyces sp. ITFR-16]|uniref:DUF5819 family protein n=1 Tax=Streptomyces sp. ITFR-16 TaxID=3075198 RepID=UPI00288B22B8|nr:DUF5819 family protein [Streptomyces sp. ITFR-16]WNI23743.1 DUF5819 family protein [Streptomyces sp. ITFR-16]